MFSFLLHLMGRVNGLKGENKLHFVPLIFAVYVPAAGAGAAEN